MPIASAIPAFTAVPGSSSNLDHTELHEGFNSGGAASAHYGDIEKAINELLALAPPGPATAALQFDGLTSYADIAASSVFDVQKLTVEAWFKLDAILSGTQMRIVNRQSTQGGPESWNLEIFGPNYGGQTGTALVFQSNDCVVNRQILVPYGFQIGVWYHAAGTNDGQTIRLYLNGVEVGTTAGAAQCIPTGVSIVIGRTGPGSQFFFPGTIDEVRFWDRARSASQIAGNMRTYLTGSETGLLGLWRFDEGRGNTSADGTGRGNFATLRNSPRWVAQTW